MVVENPVDLIVTKNIIIGANLEADYLYQTSANIYVQYWNEESTEEYSGYDYWGTYNSVNFSGLGTATMCAASVVNTEYVYDEYLFLCPINVSADIKSKIDGKTITAWFDGLDGVTLSRNVTWYSTYPYQIYFVLSTNFSFPDCSRENMEKVIAFFQKNVKKNVTVHFKIK